MILTSYSFKKYLLKHFLKFHIKIMSNQICHSNKLLIFFKLNSVKSLSHTKLQNSNWITFSRPNFYHQKPTLANVSNIEKKSLLYFHSYLLQHKQSTILATQTLLDISFWGPFRVHLGVECSTLCQVLLCSKLWKAQETICCKRKLKRSSGIKGTARCPAHQQLLQSGGKKKNQRQAPAGPVFEPILPSLPLKVNAVTCPGFVFINPGVVFVGSVQVLGMCWISSYSTPTQIFCA